MPSFNILDRTQNIHQHTMLEASAGTGKTFAIENLILRLLLEHNDSSPPLLLNRILVVTFTKAATQDLKTRIRTNLEKALAAIICFQSDKEINDSIPDYLLMHQEKGMEALTLARQRIESALYTFDQAKIFTIHGFCWRMLQTFAIEGGISVESSCSEEQTLSKTKLLQVVRNFIRTELIAEAYSPEQIASVLHLSGGHPDKLQTKLLQVISKGLDICTYPAFAESTSLFFAAMKHLKEEQGWTSQNILSDFILHVPAYKGICNRSKQIQPAIMEAVSRFAHLFDQNTWTASDFAMILKDGLVLVDVLSPKHLAAKGIPPSPQHLHYPNLLQILAKTLGPIVLPARDPHCIFARMAKDCQKLLHDYQTQEEMLGFNDLLQQMQQAITSPSFTSFVRTHFDAVIVDEFQDTDPVQWKIFHQLFATKEWPGHLYLVGDPKQSIYAFRQADIYTYLAAADALGNDSWATLDTNFRSQPDLIDALNTLFSSAHDLFPLPQQQQLLPYHPVKAGKSENKPFADKGACLQFLVADQPKIGKKKGTSLAEYEALYFFPKIAKEIIRLHVEDGIEFHRCAILVADRFQAERMSAFFQNSGIPAISQRGVNLAESTAVHIMQELLQGILHYRQAGTLKIALAGRLIGMTHDDLVTLYHDNDALEPILQQCDHLCSILCSTSFASFYPHLMQSSWKSDGKNVMQRLLEEEGGIEFYKQWQDLAELLMQEQTKKNLSPQGLIAFLDELEILAINEDERLKQTADLEQNGVIILTSHVSKGLEFDIVFALGLIKRHSNDEPLMPVRYQQNISLEAVLDKESPLYRKYCEELDAEKMRQLYVALTRAKYRLYIPVATHCGGIEVAFGSASPIELFLARLEKQEDAQPCIDYEELYRRINTYDINLLHQFAEKQITDIAVNMLSENQEKIIYNSTHIIPSLQQPSYLNLAYEPLFIQSFTSLSHSQPQSDILLFNDEKILAPHDYHALLKSTHTLPAGADTGIILHKIFEVFPFSTVSLANTTADLVPWLLPILQRTPLEPWVDVIASMAFKAITTPLTDTEASFCLADIHADKMIREADFLLSCLSESIFENANIRPGYIKGIIDLFFEHKGKYYLLDWKSNWLGPNEADYSHEKLLLAMHENHYTLQIKIYTEALRRYLKIFDPRPFEEIFGGTYYLFLRGISSNTGILHIPLQN